MPVPNHDDKKRQAILSAALDAFSTYGYDRTSMADISKRAGMSRSAVYLHFQNKEDVFRSLSEEFHAKAAERVGAALAGEGPVSKVLYRAFEAKDLEMFEIVYGSPHGAQIVDANFRIGADISDSADLEFRQMLSAWFAQKAAGDQISLGGVNLKADTLAEFVTFAMKGLKSPPPTAPEYRTRLRVLAGILAAALHGD